jgi:nucleoside-diphosphate-sugar epimerase
VEGSKYGVYNLGSGEGVSLSTIIKTAEEVVGKKAQIEYLPSPSTFVHTAILDTHRLQEEFPIRVLTNIEDGMRMTFRYIKEFVDHEK